MGSIFDVPSGLLFVLSLVTSNPNDVATAATGLATPRAATTIDLNKAPCRHSEQAWLSALHHGAGGVAYSHLASRIFRTSGGKYYVPVKQDRRHIVELQRDQTVSCFIALSSAAANAHNLKRALGRDARLDELYLAHVVGSDHAARIALAAKNKPTKRMSRLFPTLDSIIPNLYRGRNDKMTVVGFTKRLQRSVRLKVERVANAGRKKTRRRKASREPNSNRQAQQPKSLVARTTLSARDINRLGGQRKQVSKSSHKSRPTVARFAFTQGMRRSQWRLAAQQMTDTYLDF